MTGESAHLDSFARDNLPPREQWPRFVFDLPELRFPERLNAGHLLDRAVEAGHGGRTAVLWGDVAWSYDELAAAAAEVVGRDVTYTPLTTDEHVAALESFGLDAGTAGFVAGIDTGIRNGVLAETDGTLSRLIGRPTTPLVDGLRSVAETSAAASV